MKRRWGRREGLSAEDLISRSHAIRASLTGSEEVRRYAYRMALADLGYDPLDVVRARYWIRRGKPSDYEWRLS